MLCLIILAGNLDHAHAGFLSLIDDIKKLNDCKDGRPPNLSYSPGAQHFADKFIATHQGCSSAQNPTSIRSQMFDSADLRERMFFDIVTADQVRERDCEMSYLKAFDYYGENDPQFQQFVETQKQSANRLNVKDSTAKVESSPVGAKRWAEIKKRQSLVLGSVFDAVVRVQDYDREIAAAKERIYDIESDMMADSTSLTYDDV
ncbi:MAG: hypothetical protein KDD25_09520, partial [Bdellovibrionales bacterium]|nr:hypothetical protein [Bdellovibrionales bacterium]